ncbi:MAG: transcription termination factor Rho [Lachnospiraceae bacterium]|nr:transcription termination factor Rho [Lachnospiraceae bacterium]
MREKLETLPLGEIRAIAKENGIRNINSTRKSQLIEEILTLLGEKTEEKPAEETSAEAPAPGSRTAALTDRSHTEALTETKKTDMLLEKVRKENAMEGSRSTSRGDQAAESSRYAGRGDQAAESSRYAGRGDQAAENSRSAARNDAGTGEDRPGSTEQPERRMEGLRPELAGLDSGVPAHGILEIMPEGYGFIRSENYMPGDNDVYVSPSQIRRFNMKTGDIVTGIKRIKTGNEKFAALLYVNQMNGELAYLSEGRPNFEDLTPIFPDERLHLEVPGGPVSMRIVDLLSPIGKGQRGMIVSPPKAGKTTLLKQVAKSVQKNHPSVHLIILLIDERPEEVTDIKESIVGDNVEVIYSTFDELPEHHKRAAEMVLERAKRLVEQGKDVMIFLDSITRLARAYNLTVAPSGRTLSGGLDPAALHMPKRFFGAARNMREGGSLTILATALVDTGSRMDDVVYEEFKGTGNMELVLDRRLSEKRIFPAVDILKSGTRRDDLLLTKEEQEASYRVHRISGNQKQEEAVEQVLDLFLHTPNNAAFCQMVQKMRL